jgi:hypothetical protein
MKVHFHFLCFDGLLKLPKQVNGFKVQGNLFHDHGGKKMVTKRSYQATNLLVAEQPLPCIRLNPLFRYKPSEEKQVSTVLCTGSGNLLISQFAFHGKFNSFHFHSTDFFRNDIFCHCIRIRKKQCDRFHLAFVNHQSYQLLLKK